MMNKYYSDLVKWYDMRNMREKLLVLFLVFAIIYAVFSLSLLQPLKTKKIALKTQAKELNGQIKQWEIQIGALKKIPTSPLYKEWLSQNQSLIQLRERYQSLLNTPPEQQWQDVITTLINTQNNLTLAQIINHPETAYQSADNVKIKTNIYQQKLDLTVLGGYFDTIQFLQQLETRLPNLHWDQLTYQVVNYPTAKIHMEFSILYEKK